jgi:hypothetical protein
MAEINQVDPGQPAPPNPELEPVPPAPDIQTPGGPDEMPPTDPLPANPADGRPYALLEQS